MAFVLSHNLKYRLVLVGAIMELLYLSFYFVAESPDEVLLFIVVNAATFLLYAYLVYWVGKREAVLSESSNVMVWIIGFAILFRITLIFHAPVGSDDIYRYVWDGKVAAHGINPFAFAPNDTALTSLHTGTLPSLVNHPAMRTVYPPLAQAFFLFSNILFGDSLVGMKFLLIVADILSVLILVRLAGLFKLRFTKEQSVLLYAWSPLPVLYFALDGHVDALGIPFLLLFILFMTTNKTVAGAFSLGFSVVAKLYPLFLAPILFGIMKGWKKLWLPAIPVLLLVAGYWFYWQPTGGTLESFRTFNRIFEFNGSVFSVVYEIIKSNEHAHTVCAVLFLVWLAIVFFLNRTLTEKTFLSFLGFFICAPVVQPWYLTWIAALIVLRWSPAVFMLLFLSNLSNIIVYRYHSSGVWVDDYLLLLIEYVPFYCVLLWELFRTASFSRQTVVQ